MFAMSGRESKKSKGRRNLYSHSHAKSSASSAHNTGHSGVSVASASSIGAASGVTTSPFQPFGNSLTMNVCDVATEFGSLKTPSEDTEKITELMDAPVDLDIPAHAISQGQNPYVDHCMYCSAPRTDSQEGDEGLEYLDLQLDGNPVINSLTSTQSFSSLKLQIWTCAKCRKVAGNFQSFLETHLPYDVPSFLHEKGACTDSVSCEKCIEERDIHERETQELQENWVELRSIVKELYSSEEEPDLSEEQGDRLKFLVDKLCSRDPHQLFLRLESQVRELVMGIKTSLLEKLTQDGYNTPELSLAFTSSMLWHYDLLTKKAHLLAQYLGGLSEHLCRFKVTWELLNKHLFQFIVHIDPTINNSGPTILEQLRQGSLKHEKSKDDPYCVVRKRLLKFQEQMSVVVVVWRDCQQLIENYCQEEVKNTQKQVQILKEHLIKEPLMDEALSETMRNLMSGHKPSTERVKCHRCKRERCTCDECTITHMITCGIINNDKGEIPPPPNSFNFALDHTRNVVMDITPPSMSSTTSSSGSVSPINIEDKLTTFYDYDCEKALKYDFSDALLNRNVQEGKASRFRECNTDERLRECDTDDIDDNAGDDEDEEEDEDDEDDFPDSQDAGGDEPHTLQFQPRLDPELSRQLDAELAKSGLLPGGAGDEGSSVGGDDVEDSRVSADSNVSPGVFAACQCHACLKQSGHMISTSLPLQVPVSPPPAQLHLYSHIYGDGLPQQHPQRFMFDLPAPVMPPAKVPGMQDHIYHAYSDWDNTMQPRPGSLAAQHHHQHHQRLSALTSDLLPPAPLATSSPPFSFDSHLATHTSHTSTITASAFKSMAGKHLASSILPSLGHLTAEGSSVDPTKPLDFASLAKIPQSCLNVASPCSQSSFSASSSSSFSSPSNVVTTSTSTSSVTSKSSGSSHGPPCSRPSPVGGNAVASKWERGQHPPHCKKMSSGFLNKSGVGAGGGLPGAPHPPHSMGMLPFSNAPHSAPPPLPPSQAGLKNLANAGGGGVVSGGGHREDMFKTLRSNLPCAHASNPTLRPAAPMGGPSVHHSGSLTAPNALPHQALPMACSNASSLPSVVNNIGVGTSLPCSDPAYEGHHLEDNCDSVDDSCSEKSSSTSTSNQKEGKYCDCCYCEFFGHNNPQVAKTSTNYIEMKDRLRKKLKKRQTETKHRGGSPINGHVKSENDLKDPLEKKGLEGLLSFINGTDDSGQDQCKQKDNKELTAKAAKRARQKQKKLEEKARLEKSVSPSEKNREPEPELSLRHLLHNQTLNVDTRPESDGKASMGKPKLRKSPAEAATKKDSQRENTAPPAAKSQEIPRSSLIIESTRATISRSSKDLDKPISSTQQSLQSNHSSKRPTQMMQFFESFKNNSAVNAVSFSKTPGPVKNETVSSPAPSKQLRVVLQPKQQKRQASPATNKVTNGKVSVHPHSSVHTNHTTSNGRSSSVAAAAAAFVAASKPGLTQPAPTTNGFVKTSTSTTPATAASKTVPARAPASAAVTSASPAAPSVTAGKANVPDSPGAGSNSSASQSPSSGTKPAEVTKPAKAKKNKKKNKNGDLSCVDEIFMPKSEAELDGNVDEFERELEEFKRFCFEPAQPRERRKIPVNVNLKDIFKKKTGLV
ncbi:protein FAM193A isoform X2 [Aplysia californica]|uniref:Protein FAM193A isoform X2 n=1 Tax=Aplysia californica TaxID=6500 RepID=A0ABM0JDS5_APLCA|nr:protein FAM193A isoform X2 [Aplysia californica]